MVEHKKDSLNTPQVFPRTGQIQSETVLNKTTVMNQNSSRADYGGERFFCFIELDATMISMFLLSINNEDKPVLILPRQEVQTLNNRCWLICFRV